MNSKNACFAVKASNFAVAAVLMFVALSSLSPVFAHAPHDVAFDVVMSPNYKDDHTVYSIVRSNLLKSTNQGETFKRRMQGLDNKTDLYSVAVAPKLPNVLYLSTQGDGIYKSEDAGNSWHKSNEGLDTLSLTKLYAPPATYDVAFAVGAKGGLYRTANFGAHWLKVYDSSVPLSAVAGFGWNATAGQDVLIGDQNGALFLSTNAGLAWNKLHQFSSCGEITTLGTSSNPLLRDIFFVGTSQCGVFRTVDGGKSFVKANAGIEDLNIRSVVMSPAYASDKTVLASSWSEAVFISSDGGLTWQRHASGLSTHKQANKLGVPQFRNISVSANFVNDKTVFLAAFTGLFRSSVGGGKWTEKTTLSPSLMVGLAISPAYRSDSTVAVTTYIDGIYKSVNDGGSWQRIGENVESRNDDIAFSPSFPTDGVMLVTTGKENVGKSINGGESWVDHILPRTDFPTIIAFSPTFANDDTVFVATRNSSIYRSTNGGTRFKAVFDRIDAHIGHVSGLVISPDYVHDQTLVASLFKGDVYMSTDRGATWALKGSKATLGGNIKLAISPNYSADHAIFIGSTEGLFRTTDGFKTLKKISCDSCGVDGYVETIALSPNYRVDKTILMTVKGKGLFKSQNGGETFHPIASVLIKQNIIFSPWDAFPAATSSTIKFSPNYATDKTIFATSADRLFRSRDGGNTWRLVVAHSRLGE